ncbi:MAG: hypothetical protein U0790_27300 [Isosphaeraceae bacterium]
MRPAAARYSRISRNEAAIPGSSLKASSRHRASASSDGTHLPPPAALLEHREAERLEQPPAQLRLVHAQCDPVPPPVLVREPGHGVLRAVGLLRMNPASAATPASVIDSMTGMSGATTRP